MNEILIIIPTYDEKDNVGPISSAVFKIQPDAHILFVDDNSPDGTGQVIDELCKKDPRVHVLHRAGKGGLGRAYIAGFQWAIEKKYEFIFEMDADFSHDPHEIPNFLKMAENSDLVLGSRYVHGIRITNWPLRRLVLSKGAATYVRTITGMPITDPTGGFKCYRRRVLEAINLSAIESNGYSFQVEMSHSAWMKGFRIREIPITFVDRRAGYSKMSPAILKEALWMVWKLALRNSFHRAPPASLEPAPSTASASTPAEAGANTMDTCCGLIHAMRPSQWAKNLVVLAAFFFAFWDISRSGDVDPQTVFRAIPAFILFCMVSSGVYLFNDVVDMDLDRQHPTKKNRPIASGRVSRATAIFVSFAMIGLALLGSIALSRSFTLVMFAYVLLQGVYTFFLKQVPLLDVVVIATGFVLRAVAGAEALGDVTVSAWLLICTFLLALFLALCKRRHEKVSVEDANYQQRPSLQGYSEAKLDRLIYATAIATIAAYAGYTLWPETTRKFGTNWLVATLPFVILGILRYLRLVYLHNKGDRPEKILLTDIPLITNLVLYGITVFLIMRFTT